MPRPQLAKKVRNAPSAQVRPPPPLQIALGVVELQLSERPQTSPRRRW